jgi:phage tail sheath protein FI
MSNLLLASKITTEEEQPTIRAIPALDSSITGFVGLCKKGPLGTATLVQSFAQFVAIFGSYISNGYLASAVEGFFNNGGTNCYIVRVVHYTDVTDASTKTSAAGTIAIINATVTTLTVNGKYDGTYANYTIKISAATSGLASEFNLDVIDSSGVAVESYANLTMDTALTSVLPRYVGTIINDPNSGSLRIAVVDAGVVGTATARRPANITTTAMTGGNDGLASIADTDYIGSSVSGLGLYAFDVVTDLSILAVPGLATAAVQAAMVVYTDTIREGQVFAIFDPVAGNTAAQAITWFVTTAALVGLTEHGAAYWPRLKVLNPSNTVFGQTSDNTITVPPSGHIAGVYARNDNAKTGGVWTTPAGTDEGKLLGVLGLETDTVQKESVRDLVFPQRINPITYLKGFGRFIDGARGLNFGGVFPTVAQRRGMSFVERSVKQGLQPERHKNRTQIMLTRLYNTVWAFLKQQMDAGAFASNDPATAFFVDTGAALNPATVPNVAVVRYGCATVQPAEYIRQKVSQDTRAIDALLKA